LEAKRLTRKERRILRQQGFNPKYFLRINKDAESYTFVEVITGKTLLVRR
jgi:hypothetical protein